MEQRCRWQVGGGGGDLKYRFVVRSGGPPIHRVGRSGGHRPGHGRSGNLRIGTGVGALTDRAPTASQRVGAEVVSVDTVFDLRGADGYGFTVDAYDHRLTW